MSSDINVLALVKGEERYVFLFNDETRAEALRTLGRFASDPDLSFTWYDAAVLSQKVRNTNCECDEDVCASPRINVSSADDPWIIDDPLL